MASTGSIFEKIAGSLQPEVAAGLQWRLKAACRGRWKKEDYFPERGKSADAAKRVCLRCPVRGDCLTDALIRHEREGTWGSTEKERRVLLRQIKARVEAGEEEPAVIAAVVADHVPKVRLGWRPSSPTSKRYGEFLAARKARAA